MSDWWDAMPIIQHKLNVIPGPEGKIHKGTDMKTKNSRIFNGGMPWLKAMENADYFSIAWETPWIKVNKGN